MKKEMVDLILKDLPNQTAGVLRDYIDNSTRLEKEVERLEQLYKTNVEEKAKLISKNDELSKLINELQTEAQLVAANKATNESIRLQLEAKARRLDLEIMAIEKNEAIKRAEDLKEITALLVKNTSFKRKLIEETPVVRQAFSSQFNNQTGQYVNMPVGDYIENSSKETIEEITNE